MKSEINLVLCVLVVLTSSSQTRGQSSALPPLLLHHAGSSVTPDLTDNPGNEVRQRTHNPAGNDETSTQASATAGTEGTAHSETETNATYATPLLTTSAAATAQQTSVPDVTTATPSDGLSSTPSDTPPQRLPTADSAAFLTPDPLTTLSSQTPHAAQDVRSTAHASTIPPQSGSLTTAAATTAAATAAWPTTTGRAAIPPPGRGPAEQTHQEGPSELNVGDDDSKRPRHHSSSPLDPLLAGLLSVFIVTTAVVFVVLFLKFRQRTNHPEFHRLQDLPMDDLMEDTPLSRYSH